MASGFARDDDATGFLAFGVKVIKPFILTPEKGARTSVYLASSPEVADVTGQYFVKCRPRTPSPAARDEAAAALLWSVSEELVERAGTRSTDPGPGRPGPTAVGRPSEPSGRSARPPRAGARPTPRRVPVRVPSSRRP